VSLGFIYHHPVSLKFFPLRSWETPNEPGIGCKSESSCDSSNFLLFLQQLRGTSAGKKISVTASVYPVPFGGPNGGSLTDVSAYAKVLDYVGQYHRLSLAGGDH
jgi:hypothetical protein